MGNSFHLISQASAGCIIGIGGLDDILIKTGTITSDPSICPNFSRAEGLSMGLVRVTIEADELYQMNALRVGLEKLNRADPSVEFYISKNGEFILSTCGEVHLEKCLADLNEYLQNQVSFTTGSPIIPFKETCINRYARERQQKEAKEHEEIATSDSEEEEEKDAGMSLVEFLEK